MPFPLPHRAWRFRPDLRQLELRDTPGSLLETLLADALSVGTPHSRMIGPRHDPTARPPAFADEFFTGPVLPVESPAAEVPSAKASAEGSDTSARRQSSLDDLLPDWLERVSVAPARFAHAPPPVSRGEPSVVGPVEFAAIPNFRGSWMAPAAGMSDSRDESVAVQPVRTYSASMAMSSSALATVNAYDPEAAELANPPGPTTGLLEFVRGAGSTGDLEVVFHIDQGTGKATYQDDFNLLHNDLPVSVGFDTVGGVYGLYGKVTILSAQPSAAVVVRAIDELIVEPVETVDVTVVKVAGVEVPTADRTTAVVSIADNDPLGPSSPPKVWIALTDFEANSDLVAQQGPPDAPNGGRIVLRRDVADGPLPVSYAVNPSGVYTLYANGTGFAPGVDTFTLDISVDGPAPPLPNLTFTLQQSAGYTIVGPASATVEVYQLGGGSTWLNKFRVDPIGTNLTEGGPSGRFVVSRYYTIPPFGPPPPVPPPPPFPAYKLGGTAREGTDYTATKQAASTVLPGGSNQVYVDGFEVVITPLADGKYDPGEWVDFALVPDGQHVAPPSDGADTGMLIADPGPAPLPVVSVEAPDSVSAEWQQSTGSFRFLRDETKLAYPLTVSYEFDESNEYSESATHSVDYTPSTGSGTLPITGTVTFAAGQKAVEVKISPLPDDDATGDELVELKVPDGAGYAASAIAGTAAVVIKADKLEKRVILTYADGTEVTQQKGMKVSKWDNAFYLDANGKVAVRGRDAVTGYDFIDGGDGRPNDRFNVWVYDPEKWNAMAADGTTPSFPTVDVSLFTSPLKVFGFYNDPPSTLRLVRVRDGHLKGKGWYWSDSQLLVSNVVDDKFTFPAGLPASISADEAPPGPGVNEKNTYKFPVTDRTHQVALGDTVFAAYGALSASAPVKVKKTVKLNVHILLNNTVANGGQPVIAKAEVESHIARMREIYAQIGVRVEATIHDKEQPPKDVDLSNGFQYDFGGGLTDEEKKLLADSRFQSRTGASEEGRTAIEIYYINYFVDHLNGGEMSFGVPRAFSRTQAWTTDFRYADSVIMRVDKNKTTKGGILNYLVLAHESAHVLENIERGANRHYPYTGTNAKPTPPEPLDTVNLMVDGDQYAVVTGTEVIDSRRLTVDQEGRMHERRPRLITDPTP